jgi:hypothetical protein
VTQPPPPYSQPYGQQPQQPMYYPPQGVPGQAAPPAMVFGQPPKRKRSIAKIGLGIAVVLVVLGGALTLFASIYGATKFAVKGGVLLTSTSIAFANGNCYGTGGYDDMSADAQVTIYDGSGKTIAVTQLDAGTDTGGTTSCLFDFEVKVPHSTYYAIEVSHRGKVTFTEAEMRNRPALTLGNG